MKKVFTLIILAAGITTGFAQSQQYPQPGSRPQERTNYPSQNSNYGQSSSLIVTSAMPQQILVFVDNQQYQNNGNNGSGDNNGNTGNNGYGNTVNIRQLNAGSHNIAVYKWKKNFWGRQVREVIYNASLYFKPGFETTISINGLGQVNISEQQVYNNNQGGYGNNGNGVGNGYGRKKNKHKNKNKHYDKDDDDDRRYERRKYKKEKNDRDDD